MTSERPTAYPSARDDIGLQDGPQVPRLTLLQARMHIANERCVATSAARLKAAAHHCIVRTDESAAALAAANREANDAEWAYDDLIEALYATTCEGFGSSSAVAS